jgi:hypothetical protein
MLASNMTLCLDHAFITCDAGAHEATALLTHGFAEGSRNAHPGQGTENRRFFFANFMLELLWVSDQAEAMSAAVRPTGLWERWSGRHQGISRFGVIYGGALPRGSPPPFTTRAYRPAYLPPDMSIGVVQGLSLHEPAVFWMPWLGADRAGSNEPSNHPSGVEVVSGIAVGISNITGLSRAAEQLSEAGLISFFESPLPVLEIRLRGPDSTLVDCRPDLPLVFRGIRM